MDLSTIRQKNIERNNVLLRNLRIDTLTSSLTPKAKPKINQRAKGQNRIAKPTSLRRSKRLTKELGDESETLMQEKIAKEASLAREALEKRRLSRLSGDFVVKDLLADPKLGLLLTENHVYGPTDGIILLRDENSAPWHDFKNEFLALEEVGRRLTSNTPRKIWNGKQPVSKIMRKVSLDLKYSNIKITPHRITSLLFHPSSTDRVALAGDTNGSLGILLIDQTTEQDNQICILTKPHGRAITKIADVYQRPTNIMTCSYDGSCRALDLYKQTFTEHISVLDDMDNVLGISDLNCPSPNMLYITTLSGHFLKHDMRLILKTPKPRSLIKLHDKKIGGFCVNPAIEYQIATASLDRSLKVWDLRNVGRHTTAHSLSLPTPCSEYNSKLSVSNVDWSESQRLVCNGYDDRIRLFDVGNHDFSGGEQKTRKSSRSSFPLKPLRELKHNCQTGRWVSILKTRWQRSPADGIPKFCIGNMNRSIDVYEENGSLITNLSAPEFMTAVPAVAASHPTNNWFLGGTSSGKIFLFN